MMRNKKLLMLAIGVAAIGALSAATNVKSVNYSPFDKRSYLTREQIAFVRPGLDLRVRGITVGEDRRVRVEFTVADDRGLPLDLNGVFTPGPIRARFLLAYIPPGENHYISYTTRNVTSPITNVMAVQPTNDSGGSFEQVADGRYIYTFGRALPEGYNMMATHTVGIYSDRDLSEFGLSTQIDNDEVDFVPAGGEPQDVWDVIDTASCNACHDPLALHGGFRRDVKLCAMCHYDGVIDPDTGNSVDLRVMIHKIHRGENLPSVEAGTPYQIIGFNQGVNDYSEVVFPQDVRNCTTCHTTDTSQSMTYILNPNRAACGSCHDDVNFMSGVNHPGGPAISDNFCANCHYPEGELEFDASIMGAHTIPYKSRQLEGLHIELLDAVNTGPGERPTLRFRITNNAGESLDPASLRAFSLSLAGPTTDYSFLARETATTASVPMGDAYTYTFNAAIPADATGTFAIGAETSRNTILNPGTTKEMAFRETALENPVLYVAVTDSMPVPRRTIVTEARCERCHENLELHGGNRHDPEYCVVCHTPVASDGARRPAAMGPVQSIDFKFMIHRIHSGEELTRDFSVFGFGGNAINFNSVLYPGDRRNCNACHEGETYTVPSRGVLPTMAPREFFSPIAPNSAACLGCHDSLDAAAHAFQQIAPFGEACGACHGSSAEFSVAREHAR